MNQDELHFSVCVDPDADAPRVAYADFMAKYVPPRAELVRLQMERFAADRSANVTKSFYTQAEAALVRTHGPDWVRYLRMFLIPDSKLVLGCRFERGFISHARVAIENVMGFGDRLAQMAPLQHLDVTPGEASGPPARIVGAKLLGRLDSISLAGLGLTNADAPALASCEALSRARWVDLRDNDLGLEGITVLARSKVFANKVRVLLDGNRSNPVEYPFVAPDGSVSSRGCDVDPSKIEDAVGHRVPWLHYPWGHVDREPDRYYARYS